MAESLVSNLEMGGNGDTRRNRQLAKRLVRRTAAHGVTPGKPRTVSHTIFEGTSEIQQLVIARAISGLRIE
jgi:alkylation response protein AidB-like acyl-CoA dehydrogenase